MHSDQPAMRWRRVTAILWAVVATFMGWWLLLVATGGPIIKVEWTYGIIVVSIVVSAAFAVVLWLGRPMWLTWIALIASAFVFLLLSVVYGLNLVSACFSPANVICPPTPANYPTFGYAGFAVAGFVVSVLAIRERGASQPQA